MIISAGTKKKQNADNRDKAQYETCVVCGKVTPTLKNS